MVAFAFTLTIIFAEFKWFSFAGETLSKAIKLKHFDSFATLKITRTKFYERAIRDASCTKNTRKRNIIIVKPRAN